MNNFTILNTEIIDNTVKDENGHIQPSGVSVLIEFEYNNKNYHLDFQTTETYDYGAYSSNLSPYCGTDDYDKLKSTFDSEDDFLSFIEEVKTESSAQEKWSEYVTEKFVVSDDHFGGMDANSEVNKAVKRNG